MLGFNWNVLRRWRKMQRAEKLYKEKIKEYFKESKTKFEFPVSKSRADVVVFSDVPTVFEIKTERDTFFRLQRQIENYSKVFQKIYVVVPENHLKEAFEILKDSDVGIVLFDDCGELKFLKTAKISKDNLDKMEIFKILRKKEVKPI
jgi:hypothetical protein